MRSRATRKVPAKVLGVNRLATMLRNPYYIGIVQYNGKTYKGRHEPLVDETTFQEVQDLLDSKRRSGEKSWRHFHYLRGSLYCRECGGRLIYTKARGRSDTYEYFVCSGRQKGRCSQGHHRADAVEAAVERHYALVQLAPDHRESIRKAVAAHVAVVAELAAQKVADAKADLARLDAEERKLLTAHYADQVSESLFAEEQVRIRRERATAEKLIKELDIQHQRVLRALDVALAMTDRIQAAYCQADRQERRLFNQAFFERLEIDNEKVANHVLADPFAQMWPTGPTAKSAASTDLASRKPTSRERVRGTVCAELPRSRKARTPSLLFQAGGSNVASLVDIAGLEPATS